MGNEHDDDVELEVDEDAEIETERFAGDEDSDEELSPKSETVDPGEGGSDADTAHDHDDSM